MADFPASHWPVGNGEMAQRVRTADWAGTPLGPIESWPVSLKTTVDMMLGSGHAIQIAWGPERTMLYNDAYAPALGARHPAALGLPIRDAWPEVWPEIEPLFDRVFAGETVTFDALPLTLTRHGYPEETWWNFSYSPIRDESGRVAGLLNVTIDATEATLSKRVKAELRESEARFRALATAGSLNIFRMSADWRFLYQLDSDTLIPTDEPVEDWAERYVFPADLPSLYAAIDASIRDKSLLEHEHRVFQADGTIGWLFSRAVPMLDEQGEIIEWFGAATDMTERHRVAEQRQHDVEFLDQVGIDLASLSDPDEIMEVVGARVGAYLGLTGCVFCDVDEARHEVSIHYGWNSDNVPSLKQTFHLDDYVGEAFWTAGRNGETFIASDTAHDPRVSAAAYATLKVGSFVVIPFHARGVWTSYFGATTLLPRVWQADKVALLEEVSERLFARVERARAEVALRDSERRLRILVAELQHRVRNILTVVRSVFNRTIEADGGLDDVAANFRGRLDALARAQTFITRDASQTADLRTLIRDALASVGAAEGPLISIDGPEVTLNAKQIEALGLAIHELTTNALKHGALKFGEATLDIGWTVAGLGSERPRLTLIWTEQHVPVSGERSGHSGFGRELIEQVLPYRLGAETRLEFLAGGVRCTISLPLSEDEAEPPSQ